jgi:hypothetical protein
MGMIGGLLRAGGARAVGEAVGGVADALTGKREADATERALASVSQFGAEFAQASSTGFDGFVNGLNRLPRPLLALGTLGLFGYAMAEPHGFSVRMQGLGHVPEPLWWLLGAVVSFYFGARELHHQRTRSAKATNKAAEAGPTARRQAAPASDPATRPVPTAAVVASDPDYNAAVDEWRRLRG